MIAIPNMSKPKRCVEEWDFGLMGNPCKFLESDMSCLLQPESEPFDYGENYNTCPLIEISDEIWEALKPKVETMSLAERGWIIDDSNT